MNAAKVTLLIKSNTILTRETYEHFYKMFVDQLERGAVLVPSFFDVEVLRTHGSDNVEIVLTQADDIHLF